MHPITKKFCSQIQENKITPECAMRQIFTHQPETLFETYCQVKGSCISVFREVYLCSNYTERLSKILGASLHAYISVRLFATPWTVACQASLSITNSWSLFKLMSIESVMLSNHLILCHPLLLLPSVFPSIKVFSNESAFCIRWPQYIYYKWIENGIMGPKTEYQQNKIG